MAFLGYCELLCILRFQEKIINRLKSCWQNVHCVRALKKRSQLSLSIKYFEVFLEYIHLKSWTISIRFLKTKDKCNKEKLKFMTFVSNNVQLLPCL